MSSPFLDQFQEEVHGLVSTYRSEVRQTFGRMRREMQSSRVTIENSNVNKKQHKFGRFLGAKDHHHHRGGSSTVMMSSSSREKQDDDQQDEARQEEEEEVLDLDDHATSRMEEVQSKRGMEEHPAATTGSRSSSPSTRRKEEEEDTRRDVPAPRYASTTDDLASLTSAMMRKLGKNLFVAFSFAVIYLLTRLLTKFVLGLLRKPPPPTE